MLYRSKPSTIEAVQWKGDNAAEVGRIAPYKFSTDDETGEAWLKAGKNGAQGFVPIPIGHWVVRNPGDVSDLWPVDPDYFAAKYEPADSEVDLGNA